MSLYYQSELFVFSTYFETVTDAQEVWKIVHEFCILSTEFHPVVTSYIIIVQYQNQAIHIGTMYLYSCMQFYHRCG